MSLISDIKAARACSTPIIRVITPDPFATMDLIARDTDLSEEMKIAPKIFWDIFQGHQSVDNNVAGESWIAKECTKSMGDKVEESVQG